MANFNPFLAEDGDDRKLESVDFVSVQAVTKNGVTIRVGDELTWEPDEPGATERVRITRIRTAIDTDECIVESCGERRGTCWNEFERILEACFGNIKLPGGIRPFGILDACDDELSCSDDSDAIEDRAWDEAFVDSCSESVDDILNAAIAASCSEYKNVADLLKAAFPASYSEYESVEHPAHYNAHPSGIECVTIIQDFSFNVGTAVKHLWRAGLKPSSLHVVDLRKAIEYIEFEIVRIESAHD